LDENSKVFIEKPDVKNFHKHNFAPMNLYSGKVDVKIPLYEVNSKGIVVPIYLSYDTGGNKVDDISSSVGLGWSLNAGGSIIRVIKDVSDNELTISAGDVQKMGYHRRVYDRWKTNQVGNSKYIDASPDLFHVAAPDLNAKFMIVSDAPMEQDHLDAGINNLLTREFKTIFLNDNSILMNDEELHYTDELTSEGSDSTCDERVNPHYLDGFEITNSKGLEYEFEVGNVIETYTQYGLNSSCPTKSVKSWNLNSIKAPTSDNKVSFEYDISNSSRIDTITNRAYGNFYPILDEDIVFGYFFSLASGLSYSVLEEKEPRSSRLKKIIFDEGVIEFDYDFHRIDYSDPALSEIVVKDLNGKKIKGFRFIYDYFQSKDDCSDWYCKRLKLVEIREVDDVEDYEDQTVLKKHTFEYNEEGLMPKARFSVEKDYLGYYNANNAGSFHIRDLSNAWEIRPKLYYYPNQYELSLLPFKRKDILDLRLYREFGDISFEPDFEATKITSLKKINYPEGGSLELFYESQDFHFKGYDYDAPGLRVQRQELDDGSGNKQFFEYNYEETNGDSSGTFVNIPVYGYLIQAFDTSDGIIDELAINQFLIPESGNELTNNSFIGYSRIEETNNNGKKIYYYTSPKEYPNTRAERFNLLNANEKNDKTFDFFVKNSSFPGKIYTDNDIRRGKLNMMDVFDNNSNNVLREQRSYNYMVFDSIKTRYVDNFNVGITWGLLSGAKNNFIKNPLNDLVSDIGEDSNIFIERNLQTEIKQTHYFNSGTNSIEVVKSLIYDSHYPFVRTEESTNSKGHLTREELTYPYEINSTEINALTELNMISIPVESKKTENGNDIINTNEYKLLDDLPYLSATKIKKNTLPEFTNFNFEQYNNENGNLLQYSKEDGVKVAIIWGYNKTKPIAKVINSTYIDIESYVLELQNLSNADNNLDTEAALRLKLQDLRESLPEAMVSTYTYDPLIGITSMTDPRGYTMYYEYDEFNRLKYVKDAEENILKENQYNYKN